MGNEKCYICKDQARATVIVDFEKTSLKEIKEKLLQTDLAMINPDAEIAGNVIIDSEDVDEDMLEKKLSDFKDLGVFSGCIIKVEDFSQDFEIELTFVAKGEDDDFEENYKMVEDGAVQKKPTQTAEKRKLPDTTIVQISKDLEDKSVVTSPDGKR